MKLTRRRFLIVTGTAASAAACGASRMGQDANADAPGELGDTVGPDVPGPEDASPDVPAVDVPAMDAAPDVSGDDVPSDVSMTDVVDPDPTAIMPDTTVFPLGMMAGDATAERAVVWTRYTGTRPLILRVVEMEGTRFARIVHEREVAVSPDGFVHEDVPTLAAGRRYNYAFLVRDGATFVSRSTIGRFRAALDPDSMDVVTFAGTSCTHQRARPFPVLANAAMRPDLDFFVHAGDHVYCDGAGSLSEFRAKYLENWPSAGMAALHASAGLYCTLDDHEVDNDFDPETISATTLANARTAYFEHRAQRRDPMNPGRIWRSVRWGRTLELFVLDCRTERRPSTRSGAGAIYLSRAQMDWLKSGLMSSPAVFKFVVTSVPITNFPILFDVAAGDRWEGYPAQRQELLDFIQTNTIRGVWWLSGDFHLGSIGGLEPSGPLATMREVLMGPGGNNGNVLAATLGAPQFDFATTTSNYTWFRVDPSMRTVDVAFINAAGTDLFRRRYTSA